MEPARPLAPRLPSTAILLAPLVLLLSACGPAPRDAADPGEAPVSGASPAQTIYVSLGAQPEAPVGAQPKAPVGAQPEAPVEHRVPEEPQGDNPFERVRTWIGDYECPQGRTNLTLHVTRSRADRVKAIFAFNHAGSGAKGEYLLEGSYDRQTRTASFTPGAWLRQPPGYETVGMTGVIARDGSMFTGTIDHPACGDFRLQPAN